VRPKRVLTSEQLDVLRSFSSPTICNAIERFEARKHNEGFMLPEIRAIFPEMGVMIGYACTSTIRSSEPPAELLRHGANPDIALMTEYDLRTTFDYWDHAQAVPRPRVAVIQDLDALGPRGALWGEVNANIHRALGFVGTITNGSVRDLDEVRRLGFFFFARDVVVSHCYVHHVESGNPVKVGGVVVNSGDLIHADQHGVVVIPEDIAAEVASVAREIEAKEKRAISLCQAPSCTVEMLKEMFRELVH
jgi:4-hydroxy-4-methyl-2-oxoglutarate aldolase